MCKTNCIGESWDEDCLSNQQQLSRFLFSFWASEMAAGRICAFENSCNITTCQAISTDQQFFNNITCYMSVHILVCADKPSATQYLRGKQQSQGATATARVMLQLSRQQSHADKTKGVNGKQNASSCYLYKNSQHMFKIFEGDLKFHSETDHMIVLAGHSNFDKQQRSTAVEATLHIYNCSGTYPRGVSS